jgi:hypothetical protein
MTQYDREEQSIIDAEEHGEITPAEAQRQLRDLRDEYSQAARDSAQEVYDRELGRW